jgi:RNA polymerase sigma-70 factor, ECF subfamily
MALEPSKQPTAALDPSPLIRLFDECLPSIYAYVASRTGERAAAEEITAATFRRALEVAREETFDATGFVSFAFRVAATAVVDHARRGGGVDPRGARAADFDRVTHSRRAAQAKTDDLPARAFDAAMDRRALRRAVQRLSDPQRRLILLRYLDGLTIDEQCAVLGWSREALTRNFHGALRSLHAAVTAEASDAA